MVDIMAGHFTPGETSVLPTELETGWALEPVYVICRTEKSLAPPMIQIEYCPASSLVTVQAFLRRYI